MEKILNLLNVKKWVSEFVFKILLNKGVKHAATTLAGIVGGLVAKYQLDKYGITVDVPHMTEGLMVSFGAVAGAFINWAQRVMDPDGDGLIGTANKV